LKKLLIVGMGLIGGSIAKASKGFFENIYAYSQSASTILIAEADGVIDKGFSNIESLPRDIDLVCLCTPVSNIVPIAEQLYAFLDKGALFTDAGSTKLGIVEEMRQREIPFVGGHPMAGKERSGYAASSKELFINANWVLTPCNNDNGIEQLHLWVEYMGARAIVMDASDHDIAAAAISHLPHIAASALTEIAAGVERDCPEVRLLAAGGFLDITRIASSDPLMWQNIFLNNKEPVLTMLSKMQAILKDWQEMISNADADALLKRFEATKKVRDSYKKENK